MTWLMAHMTLILAFLLGLSEALAVLPGVKSNSIFQLIVNVLKSVVGSKPLTPVEAQK